MARFPTSSQTTGTTVTLPLQIRKRRHTEVQFVPKIARGAPGEQGLGAGGPTQAPRPAPGSLLPSLLGDDFHPPGGTGDVRSSTGGILGAATWGPSRRPLDLTSPSDCQKELQGAARPAKSPRHAPSAGVPVWLCETEVARGLLLCRRRFTHCAGRGGARRP